MGYRFTNSQIYEQVIETLRERVIIVDADLTFFYMNKAAEHIGLNPENVIGKSLFSVFPNLSKSNSTILKVLESGQSIIDNVQTFITYRGERKTTLTSTYPIYEDNVIVGVFEVFEDVSALHDTSERLVHLQQQQSESQNKKNPYKISSTDHFIGATPEIQQLKEKIPVYAKSTSPIFLYGETGTGKELVVQAIKNSSMEKNAPFIAQNCAAIPESLLEGILFGTVKGSFTGAEDRPGLFELADGGLLFLDEINSMPLSLQGKLLRVLQDKKVRRVGGSKEISVSFRLIAATNVPPKELLHKKELRADLYYRLNVLYLELPPLRNRKSDIPLLVDHFINLYNDELQKSVIKVDEEVMDYFYNYNWPGNIRELRNMIERAMNLTTSSIIQKEDIQVDEIVSLPPQTTSEDYVKNDRNTTLQHEVRKLEIDLITKQLSTTNGNISKAARNLDIPQQTLSNKIKKYNLNSEVYKQKMKNLPKIE
ncbi:PAS domain S-box protein [Pontibacillus yanchengensis]|uniref:PAS domain S-box protein n=1 Tax=Pontibacillus yanchengensis TaxID=462910 RepID=A0ACC7VG22_9BACI|nr:sigma 54-interacting transcriptional regulator [Pontibacillus yanchengensis]MYL53871.1 PAS domain S-box protein [Pontibacillus yanchengensis]